MVSPLVKIIQFSMLKCPDTSSWTAHFNTTAFHPSSSLRSFVDFSQSYVGGDEGEGPVTEDNWMNCFHGPSECLGHKTMLCARDVSAKQTSNSAATLDYRWFDMIVCMGGPGGIPGVTYNHTYSIPNNAESCAVQAGLDWSEINSCVHDDDWGGKLLHDSHFDTMELFAKHGGYKPEGHGYKPPFIPNIWIFDTITGKPMEYNDKFDHERNPYVDIVKRICDAGHFEGEDAPSECAE